MKFEKGVLIFGFCFLILIFLGGVDANSCAVKKISECTGTWNNIVLQLSSNTNAHAQKWDASPQYDYALCCDFVGSKTCGANNKILKLSSDQNAHAESPSLSNYPIAVCYGDNPSCVVTDNTCPLNSGKNAILSLSSETNAHVGNPNAYSKKICCTIDAGPFCGNNVREGTEECDDGNSVNTDACTNSCKNAKCGDGIRNTPAELASDGCDLGNQNGVKGSGCSVICKLEAQPFTPKSCSEISPDNYDNKNLQEIIELCNNPPNRVVLPTTQEGCTTICKWNNGVCETAPDASNIKCQDCKWEDSPQDSCGENVDFITIEYKLIEGDPVKCKINSQTVPCSESTMLPFFGIYQVVGVLVIIFLIYIFMILRRKKRRK